MSRRLLVVVLVVAAVVVVVAASVRGGECEGYAFDRAGWEAGDIGRDGGRREEAASRLVECDRLEGRTRSEVLALLGPPVRGGVAGAAGRSDSWIVGSDDLADGKYLGVSYSSRGRVERVEQLGASW